MARDNTIRGLRIESSGDDIGLFGVASGNINDVRIEGAEIIGGKNVGTLVGKYTGGAISNVHITEDEEGKGSVKSTAAADSDVYVGGLVGHMSSATDPAVTESSSAVAVEALGSYVGGLIGRQAGNGQITKSYTTGNVTGKNYVGGITGRNNINSEMTGYVSGDISGEEYVGGLLGYSRAIVRGYTTGAIRGTKHVGGIIGYADEVAGYGYSTGDVSASGDYVGGLSGYGKYAGSSGFSTGTIRGNEYVGGIIGYVRDGVAVGYATGDVIGANSVGGLVGGDASNFGNTGYFRGNVISTASDPSSATDFGLTVGNNTSTRTASYYYSTKDGEGGLYQLSNGKRIAYSPTTDETATNYRASTQVGLGVSVASSDTEDAIKAKFIGFTGLQWSFIAGQWPAYIAIQYNTEVLPDFGDIPNSAEAQKPYTAP